MAETAAEGLKIQKQKAIYDLLVIYGLLRDVLLKIFEKENDFASSEKD